MKHVIQGLCTWSVLHSLLPSSLLELAFCCIIEWMFSWYSCWLCCMWLWTQLLEHNLLSQEAMAFALGFPESPSLYCKKGRYKIFAFSTQYYSVMWGANLFHADLALSAFAPALSMFLKPVLQERSMADNCNSNTAFLADMEGPAGGTEDRNQCKTNCKRGHFIGRRWCITASGHIQPWLGMDQSWETAAWPARRLTRIIIIITRLQHIS